MTLGLNMNTNKHEVSNKRFSIKSNSASDIFTLKEYFINNNKLVKSNTGLLLSWKMTSALFNYQIDNAFDIIAA